jgi:hypothetical protein
MTNRQRISRRVVRRFLQLAAVAFAIGADVPPAAAAGGAGSRGTPARRGEPAGDPGLTETAAAQPYRHAFSLGAASAGRVQARARVRIVDGGGRTHARLALHGAGMVGPLPHGAYTVVLEVDGLTEVHRLRIGPDTLPWLQFSEPV